MESRDRIGGRVWDDNKSLGCCVGRGAQILNGCINNPISVLCVQVSPPYTHFIALDYVSPEKTFPHVLSKLTLFIAFLVY